MSACLWADIDAYLVTAVTTDVGAASAYTTQKVGDVIVGTMIDEQHTTLPLPAVLIVGEQAQHGPEGDTLGGSAVWIYPYMLVAVTGNAAYATLKANLQELGRRLRILATTRAAFGRLTATDGEYVWNTELGAQALQLWGPVEGLYYGTVEQPLVVSTRTLP